MSEQNLFDLIYNSSNKRRNDGDKTDEKSKRKKVAKGVGVNQNMAHNNPNELNNITNNNIVSQNLFNQEQGKKSNNKAATKSKPNKSKTKPISYFNKSKLSVLSQNCLQYLLEFIKLSDIVEFTKVNKLVRLIIVNRSKLFYKFCIIRTVHPINEVPGLAILKNNAGALDNFREAECGDLTEAEFLDLIESLLLIRIKNSSKLTLNNVQSRSLFYLTTYLISPKCTLKVLEFRQFSDPDMRFLTEIILKNNSISNLYLRGNYENFSNTHFCDALQRNAVLTEISLECDNSFNLNKPSLMYLYHSVALNKSIRKLTFLDFLFDEDNLHNKFKIFFEKTKIEKLVFTRCGHTNVSKLTKLLKLNNTIKTLSFEHMEIDTAFMKHLTKDLNQNENTSTKKKVATVNKSVKTLKIMHCHLTHQNCYSNLANLLENNSSLTALKLVNCKINDNQIETILPALKSHPSIRILNLRNNNITRGDKFDILSENKVIESLDFSKNRIEFFNHRSLIHLINFTNITELKFNDNLINEFEASQINQALLNKEKLFIK